MAELIARRRAHRILIVSPAGPLSLVSDAVALPALGWPTTRQRSAPATPLACWFESLVADDLPSYVFGARVIKGLRSLFKPHALLGTKDHRGRDVPEATQLERLAGHLRTLRFYGSGYTMGLTDADSGLALNGERGFFAHNLCKTKLRSATVELWAATSDQSEMTRICENRTDRVPGLARAFLAAGADGVLDLAWPVHDLVKALVCERYTMLRHAAGVAGPEALCSAIEWVSWMNSGLWTEGITAMGEINARIDRLRRDSAAELKIDPDVLVPFTGASTLSADGGPAGREFVEEISRHSHTAAFRWWGG